VKSKRSGLARRSSRIAGTLASLPVHIRDKDRRIATPTTLLEQIDPDVPNVVTFSQTYEDLLFEGISFRDFPVVQGVVIIGGAMIVVVNLLVDILYAFIDPRIRLES